MSNILSPNNPPTAVIFPVPSVISALFIDVNSESFPKSIFPFRARPLISASISALNFPKSALILEIFIVTKRECILLFMILSLSR